MADLVGFVDAVIAEECLGDVVDRCEYEEFPELFAEEAFRNGITMDKAWSVIHRFDQRWGNKVIRFLSRQRLPGGFSPQDVWHEVMMELVQKWSEAGFEQKRNWQSYLVACCQWWVRRQFQTSSRRRLVFVSWPRDKNGAMIAIARKMQRQERNEELAQAFRTAVERLTEYQRVVFEIFCTEALKPTGVKDREIVEQLWESFGIRTTEVAVNKLMQRIRHKLWAELHRAGVVSSLQAPALGSGARIRAA